MISEKIQAPEPQEASGETEAAGEEPQEPQEEAPQEPPQEAPEETPKEPDPPAEQ